MEIQIEWKSRLLNRKVSSIKTQTEWNKSWIEMYFEKKTLAKEKQDEWKSRRDGKVGEIEK